jgi:hypothetical protein
MRIKGAKPTEMAHVWDEYKYGKGPTGFVE